MNCNSFVNVCEFISRNPYSLSSHEANNLNNLNNFCTNFLQQVALQMETVEFRLHTSRNTGISHNVNSTEYTRGIIEQITWKIFV